MTNDKHDSGTAHPYGSDEWEIINVGWTDEELKDLYGADNAE